MLELMFANSPKRLLRRTSDERASMHRVGSFNTCHLPSATHPNQSTSRSSNRRDELMDLSIRSNQPNPRLVPPSHHPKNKREEEKKRITKETHQSASRQKPPSSKTTPRQSCPSQNCKPAIHSRRNPSPQAPEPIVGKIGLAWNKALFSLLLLLCCRNRFHLFVQPMRRRGMMASRFRRNGGGEDDWLLGEARRLEEALRRELLSELTFWKALLL